MVASFQASARFVWPVIYLIGLLAVAGVWHAYSFRTALLLLSMALGLQVWDTAPLWQVLRHHAMSQPEGPPDEQIILDDINKATRVTFVPTYLCEYAEQVSPDARDASIEKLTDLEILASRCALPANSVRHSRQTATDVDSLRFRCDTERQAAQAQVNTPGTVTMVLNGVPAEASLRAALMQRAGCAKLRNL
jgi:hypothetical protein